MHALDFFSNKLRWPQPRHKRIYRANTNKEYQNTWSHAPDKPSAYGFCPHWNGTWRSGQQPWQELIHHGNELCTSATLPCKAMHCMLSIVASMPSAPKICSWTCKILDAQSWLGIRMSLNRRQHHILCSQWGRQYFWRNSGKSFHHRCYVYMNLLQMLTVCEIFYLSWSCSTCYLTCFGPSWYLAPTSSTTVESSIKF